MTESMAESDREVLSIAPGPSVALIGLTGLIGAVLLAVLPRMADWLLRLPWVPFEGPLQLLQRLNGQLSWPLFAVVGLVLGVLVGLVLRSQTVKITMNDREIVVVEGSKRARIARAQVDRVLVNGNRLTVRDTQDIDLVDTKAEVSGPVLADALTRHGWPVRHGG